GIVIGKRTGGSRKARNPGERNVCARDGDFVWLTIDAQAGQARAKCCRSSLTDWVRRFEVSCGGAGRFACQRQPFRLPPLHPRLFTAPCMKNSQRRWSIRSPCTPPPADTDTADESYPSGYWSREWR